MTTIEITITKAAEIMGNLTAEAMAQGMTFDQAYTAARSYLVGRWAYLAEVIPATIK